MITPASRGEWRAWLKANHASAHEAWVVYYKKHTGKPSLSYPDSVAEALCFGWIDGIRKRIDDERYMHRFTPRRPRSHWSAANVSLARELIASGAMTEAGMAAFKRRKDCDETGQRRKQACDPSIQAGIEERLKANEKAWDNLHALAQSYRRNCIAWVQDAKKPETREKRLRELIEALEKGEKLGMK